ncbi:MAG: hypothetical protein P8Y99_05995 [Calditrichaceae bacterium]
MNIQKDWPEIRKHFITSFRSNFHVAIASVDKDNNPTVTPIGSLFLNKNSTGYYFEKYPHKLEEHAKKNKNICVLAVNSGRLFWLKALYRGKFDSHPGIKLYGVLGDRRDATHVEIERLNRRMQATRWLKGNHYLWGHMPHVRDIKFTKAEKINLGAMTEEL